MATPLFKAKFRIVENSKAEKETDPTHKIPMQFSLVDARAAAQYLIDMANNAEKEGTTVRQYKSQSEYVEVPGITCWMSMWDQAGSWAPMPPKEQHQQTERRKAFATIDDLEESGDIPF